MPKRLIVDAIFIQKIFGLVARVGSSAKKKLASILQSRQADSAAARFGASKFRSVLQDFAEALCAGFAGGNLRAQIHSRALQGCEHCSAKEPARRRQACHRHEF